MAKRAVVAAVLIGGALLVAQKFVGNAPSRRPLRAAIASTRTNPDAAVAAAVRAEDEPFRFFRTRDPGPAPSTQTAADWLKEEFATDPERLLATLRAIAQAPLESRRRSVPLLANALILWPEADARCVFTLADAYAETDMPEAGEWACVFLSMTGRNDLAVSTLPGRLASFSEERSLALIACLPAAARVDALRSAAYHIGLGDLKHLASLCANMDPETVAAFAPPLFERLAMESLNETAGRLTSSIEASRIPGAVSAIGRALVRSGHPNEAIRWADSLPDKTARADAISAVYQQWAQLSPANAIQDILDEYDGAPILLGEVFKSTSLQHGNAAAQHWAAACSLENPTARTYAISSLIEPMLLTVGTAGTRANIEALAEQSLERGAAELAYRAALKNPAVVTRLEAGFESTRHP